MCIKLNSLKVENGKLYGTVKWTYEFKGSKRITGIVVHFEGEPVDTVALLFHSFLKPVDMNEGKCKVLVSDNISARMYTRAIIECFAAVFEKVDE